jgi:hypothetical protein
MKKLFSFFLFVLSCTFTLTQTDQQVEIAPLKRFHVGFNLGVNYSNLLVTAKPDYAEVSNKIGARLGVLADFRLNKIISWSPKAELVFNDNKIRFQPTEDISYTYKVMPMSLEIMNHFVFKDAKRKVSPYFYFGPNVRIPLQKRITDTSQFRTNPDFAIDFGIGLEKPFNSFRIAPELRYSMGLRNVNGSAMIKSVKFHTVSLIFNFTS